MSDTNPTSKTVTVLTAAKITELTTKFPGLGEDTFVHERDYNQAENGRVARADQIERLQRERDAWESTAAQFARNMEYYRTLVDRVGCAIGKEAYTADDGSISDDVLRAKVPEIIERLLKATPVETTANCEHEWSASRRLHECLKGCDFVMDADGTIRKTGYPYRSVVETSPVEPTVPNAPREP